MRNEKDECFFAQRTLWSASLQTALHRTLALQTAESGVSLNRLACAKLAVMLLSEICDPKRHINDGRIPILESIGADWGMG